MKKILLTISLLALALFAQAEDGYRLWLRYDKITDPPLLSQYNNLIKSTCVTGNSPILLSAKQEMEMGLNGLLGRKINTNANIDKASILAGRLINIPGSYKKNRSFPSNAETGAYMIYTQKLAGATRIVIAGIDDNGVLYGVFHLLRLLQTRQSISNIDILSSPKLKLRLLNHWDNLNRTVERGYAGFSLWNWHTLPGYKDKRYTDYARANASIGINGTVLTNYLQKSATLADIFRAYGIKVYLTARFSAPVEIGGLKTADPLDTSVQRWWRDKTKEIYSLIPDFGGFLVKANSEGQPGPQNYGRNHADGANML
jgi:alpha-glucuronidase